jgi:hypothetical protein
MTKPLCQNERKWLTRTPRLIAPVILFPDIIELDAGMARLACDPTITSRSSYFELGEPSGEHHSSSNLLRTSYLSILYDIDCMS